MSFIDPSPRRSVALEAWSYITHTSEDLKIHHNTDQRGKVSCYIRVHSFCLVSRKSSWSTFQYFYHELTHLLKEVKERSDACAAAPLTTQALINCILLNKYCPLVTYLLITNKRCKKVFFHCLITCKETILFFYGLPLYSACAVSGSHYASPASHTKFPLAKISALGWVVPQKWFFLFIDKGV